MALDMSPIDRIERDYDVTVLLPNGNPTTVDSIDLAILGLHDSPTADTDWTTLPVVEGVVTVIYTAPEATAEDGDLLVPLGDTNAHAREVDGTLVKAIEVERISVS